MVPPTPMGTPLTIVVDDEPLILDLVIEGLEAEGHKVQGFHSADDAWAFISKLEAPIRLLVSDLRMPGRLTGANLATRAHQHSPDAKIVLSSGYLEELETDRPAYVTFLKKPWGFDQLFKVCSTTL